MIDAADEPSVHPSRVSGRTEERSKSLEIFPFMLSMSKHSWGYSAESMIGIYDRDGKPIRDRSKWAKLLADENYKRIDNYQDDRIVVSTVWIGIDLLAATHGYKPRIFETVILQSTKTTLSILFNGGGIRCRKQRKLIRSLSIPVRRITILLKPLKTGKTGANKQQILLAINVCFPLPCADLKCEAKLRTARHEQQRMAATVMLYRGRRDALMLFDKIPRRVRTTGAVSGAGCASHGRDALYATYCRCPTL